MLSIQTENDRYVFRGETDVDVPVKKTQNSQMAETTSQTSVQTGDEQPVTRELISPE